MPLITESTPIVLAFNFLYLGNGDDIIDVSRIGDNSSEEQATQPPVANSPPLEQFDVIMTKIRAHRIFWESSRV